MEQRGGGAGRQRLGGYGPTSGLFRGEGLPGGLTAQELIDVGAAIETGRSAREQH